MSALRIAIAALPLALALPVTSQQPAASQQPTDSQEGGTGGFEDAADTAREKLEQSLEELAHLREQIIAEKLPLSARLGEFENELSAARRDHQQTSRLLDGRTLDLSNLQTEIARLEEEARYVSQLAGEYGRNLTSRLQIAEVQRHGERLDAVRLAEENEAATEEQRLELQLDVLDLSLERLDEALGGARFSGTAVNTVGLVTPGTFLLLGPAALFLSKDGSLVGTVEERVNSSQPTIVPFADPADAFAATELVRENVGRFPLDTTLGNAHKLESTRESFAEHVRKGGPVMIPIFAMAAAALLVALYRLAELLFLPGPGRREVERVLDAVRGREASAAAELVLPMKGPLGRMLAVGVEHLGEPVALIEEVMYESVLTARHRLQRLLPFIAICAAAAPLLGLLGTVTGIISTFKLITVFGSGDVKSLSGGISEALITTKFGLIVAIPSLMLHALLARWARAKAGRMEAVAVAFVNQVGLSGSSGSALLSQPSGWMVEPRLTREELRDWVQGAIDEHLNRSEGEDHPNVRAAIAGPVR